MPFWSPNAAACPPRLTKTARPHSIFMWTLLPLQPAACMPPAQPWPRCGSTHVSLLSYVEEAASQGPTKGSTFGAAQVDSTPGWEDGAAFCWPLMRRWVPIMHVPRSSVGTSA